MIASFERPALRSLPAPRRRLRTPVSAAGRLVKGRPPRPLALLKRARARDCCPPQERLATNQEVAGSSPAGPTSSLREDVCPAVHREASRLALLVANGSESCWAQPSSRSRTKTEARVSYGWQATTFAARGRLPSRPSGSIATHFVLREWFRVLLRAARGCLPSRRSAGLNSHLRMSSPANMIRKRLGAGGTASKWYGRLPWRIHG